MNAILLLLLPQQPSVESRGTLESVLPRQCVLAGNAQDGFALNEPSCTLGLLVMAEGTR